MNASVRTAPTLSIVIVNWNAGTQLRDCVQSIITTHDERGFRLSRIILVDNGSTDESLGHIAHSDMITVVRANHNLGFARACNLGAAAATSEFLLFLNPDARVLPGALGTVCEFMTSEAATSVGICGVKLVDENNAVHRHCARFPSVRTYVCVTLALSRLLPTFFPSHYMTDFDHLTSRQVDHVMGAFFLVRRTLFDALQGFDERFFVYLEDVDFSLRAKRAGWTTYYLAEAAAFHRGGGTSTQVKAHRLFYSLRSRILYSFKHFRRPGAWLVTGLTISAEPVARLVRAIARRSLQEAVSTIRGWLMLVADLWRILRTAHRMPR